MRTALCRASTSSGTAMAWHREVVSGRAALVSRPPQRAEWYEMILVVLGLNFMLSNGHVGSRDRRSRSRALLDLVMVSVKVVRGDERRGSPRSWVMRIDPGP